MAFLIQWGYALAIEIADAYIALYTRLPGVAKDIEAQLGAAVPDATAKPASQLGTGLMDGAANVIKGGAIALGGLVAAGLGTALVKGFQRLDALDQAEAKLSGLGHSAQGVDQIMNNALASVKGTAFGMGDAATVAASVVAAGVKPGEELERTLKLVGDAATIAGTDMSTMGSIVNKVATSDMMQMDVANQLMDAGIPILQLLASQMGITADEARTMASEGKISFDDFQAALESGLGGAALESGSTFQGAMDNVMAALGRIGESLLGGVFENLKGEFGDVAEWLDSLGPAFDTFGENVGAFAADAIPVAVEAIKGLVDGIVGLVTWIQDNADWLAALAIGIGIFAVAIGGYAIALAIVDGSMKAWFLTTQIGTGIMAVFNTVMAMNPIMLVVLAVIALVAALVWFFTQTELGKEVWENVTNAISTAITWLWESVLKPTFDAIGAVFVWIYETILKPVAEGIIAVFNGIGAVVTWLYENIIKPIFDGIAAVFTFINDIIITPIAYAIILILHLLGMAFDWLYANVIKPVFDGIAAVFQWIYDNVITPIINGVIAYINLWGSIFTWLYENIVKPIFDGIGAVFTWLYENVIKPVWEGIQNAIKVVADWIQNTLWPGIQTVLGFMGDGFKVLQDTIATVWENIKKAALAPVNFVIGTIYNDGIAKLFNDIAGAVGLDLRLEPMGLLSFAQGGVLPGYTPGRDVHQFYSPTGGLLELSGGEPILRPEAGRVLGSGWVHGINAAARTGGTSGVAKFLGGGGQAFADGGIWEAVGGTFKGAGDWLGSVVGAVAEIIKDPLGAIDRLILDPVKGLLEGLGGGFLGDVLTTLPLKAIEGIKSWFSGMVTPLSQGANGDWIGGNTLDRLMPIIQKYGLMITDTYGSPEYNRSLGRTDTSYHGDINNPAVDMAGSQSAMFAAAAEIYAMGGWRQILWQVAGHYDHIHVANQGGVFGDLPTRAYDSGGYLAPGLTLAYNGTGKPEPILTADQWGQMGRSNEPQIVVNVHAAPGMSEETIGRIAADRVAFEMRSAR